MNDRLPFVFEAHTGSPVGYSEVAALLFRSMLELGVEVHYQSLAEDYIYEQPSYDMVVNAFRKIEPERGLPWVTLATGPLLYLNGGDYKIGWTMMEVDRITERWVRACNSMDEVWVPTAMQAEGFAASGVTVPIFVVPLGIDHTRFMPSFLPAIYHGPHNFRFIDVAWWQERKRPDLISVAFAEEFGGDKDVGLIFKTMTAMGEDDIVDHIHEWVGHRVDDQIAVIEGGYPWWELVMMIRSCQCFVLPTAGEGWGCPPVQALACGLPVIVTDCQGPGEVLRDDDTGKPYPGVYFLPAKKEVTAVKHEYYEGANWWATDVEHIRKAMREVYENYAYWRKEALIGAEKVREQRSGLVMAKAVKSRLAKIYEKRGL